MTRLLGREQLAEFEDLLLMAGAPVVDHLGPGATDATFDEIERTFGIRLPDEARVWWSWHDGPAAGTPPARALLLPNRVQESLRGAVDYREVLRPYVSERPVQDTFDAQLLLLVSEKPFIYAACAGERSAPAPIYTQQDIEDPAQQLPSIGDLVERWCWLIREEIWAVDSEGSWVVDSARIPPGFVEMGIV